MSRLKEDAAVDVLSVIRTLRLVDFRCLEQARLEIPEEGIVFVGQNAQGKTSLLEAVCLLLRLQSPRARQMKQLIRESSTEFGIAGEAWERELQIRGDARGLSLRANGEAVVSRRDYLTESGLVVWMGNDDLDLVRGGGESRRRYLDFLASQVDPEYRYHWMRYRKALSSRNKALKSLSPREAEVKAFTGLLIQHGSEMITRREQLCQELTPRATENHQVVSGQEEEISLQYRDRAKGDLEKAFAEAEASEERRQMTLVGPHRDDLKLTIAERSARDFGSEGQQRTLALSLKLAQGEVLRARGNVEPIYLIDDVFGELDPQRRNALMSRLPAASQKLITTTSLDWWEREEVNLSTMSVAKGRVS